MSDDTLPTATSALVPRLQDEQRAHWRRGERIPVEVLLERYPAVRADPDALLDLLYNEILIREECGEAPRLEEYLARFPELTQALRDQFEVHGALASQELFPPAASATRPGAGGGIVLAQPVPPVDVPGYEVLGELGRGGMGVVYKAWQVRLNRLVALKVLRAGAQAEGVERERFRTEAEAAARLQHAHINQIHEVGEHAGQPYLALEYVDGGSLGQKLARGPLPAREAAALIETVTRAMQYAHQRGVVHRDLTPNNVLLTAEGQPKVADFGLARLAVGGARQTISGAVLGTPSYMAPEQASGRNKEVGPVTDVYALGAILYECLTGRPPFKGATALDTLMLVTSEEPVSPRRLQPRTPRDLETICLKCLQKEPRKRYASAEALAEDLRRFLAGEPIRARPVSSWERGVKWVHRRPVQAALLGLSAVAGLALIAALAALWQHAEARAAAVAQLETAENLLAARQAQLTGLKADVKDQQRLLEEKRTEIGKLAKVAAEQRENVREARAETHRAFYIWDMQRADTALQKSRSDHLLRILEAYLPRAGQEDVRGLEWHFLWRCCRRERFTFRGHPGNVVVLTLAPDGKTLCSVDDQGNLKLWDAATGKPGAGPLKPMALIISAAAFSPDGKLLATGSTLGNIRLWDRSTGKDVAQFRAHSGPVLDLAFAPDGTALASGGKDNLARIWDVATRKERAVCKGHADRISFLTFSPDGRLLATASYDRTARLWETATGKERHTFPGERGAWVHAVAFAPDGRTVATVEAHPFRTRQWAGSARLWDLVTLKEWNRLDVPEGGAFGVTFSPDGRTVAVATNSGVVLLWDPATPTAHDTLAGHRDRVHRVIFSPDGLTLVSSGNDRTVKVWGMAARPNPDTLNTEQPWLTAAVLTADGKVLVTGSRDGTLRWWDRATGRVRSSAPAHDRDVVARLAPDGKTLATAGGGQLIKLWEAGTGKLLDTLKGEAEQHHAVAFAPDGLMLAAARSDGGVDLWDLHTRRCVTLRDICRSTRAVAFSPDGNLLASAGADEKANYLTLWDLATRQPRDPLITRHNIIMSLDFSHDSKLLASAHYGGVVKVWDSATSAEVAHLVGHLDPVLAVAFSPIGKTLASAGADGTVKLWDAATWRERFTLRGHTTEVSTLVFSADGSLLVTGGRDGTARVWDATPVKGSPPLVRASGPSATERRAWHVREAEAAQRVGHWSAAIWHLDRLIAPGPAPAAPGSGVQGLRQMVREFGGFHSRRAEAHAELGQWTRAVQDYRKATSLADDAKLWYHLALCRLAARDVAGYRNACATLLQRFGRSLKEDVPTWVAHPCTWGPAAPDDLTSALTVAKRQAARHPDSCGPLHTLGALLYRAGRFEDAVAKLQTAIEMKTHAKDGGTIEDWLFLAMAHHRLDEAAEAKKWLAKATQHLDSQPPAPSYPAPGAAGRRWYERLGPQLLRREAEALIKSATE
jgi:WD40 repeat protein/tetratricopeptide (TPR) repeat protein